MTTVVFKTSDNVKITGDFYQPAGSTSAVLLLHMMPSTRKSYESLAETLNKAGFTTLAIDLRGHGDSVSMSAANGDIVLNFKKFTPLEHQASRLDVDAAMNFLKQKGFSENEISFVGASIGANLSLDALYRYAGTHRAVLLSPGLDYRGVITEIPMKKLQPTQNVWLISAERDEYSVDAVYALHVLQPKTSTLTVFSDEEHGTDLLEAHPQLADDIVKFFAA